MMMNQSLVYFAHGKESGPWGSKIERLATIARAKGFAVHSPDYSHTHDPTSRLAQLIEINPQAERLVLVGSSMGGYVSAMACEHLRPSALFLMAPALYFEEFAQDPVGCPSDTVVVHGWRDDIVPPERALRFSQPRRAQLHLVDDGHRLSNSLDFLCEQFSNQLLRVTEHK